MDRTLRAPAMPVGLGTGPSVLVVRVVRLSIAALPKIAHLLLPSLLQGWDLVQPIPVHITIRVAQVLSEQARVHAMPAAAGIALVQLVWSIVAALFQTVHLPLPELLREVEQS